MTAAPAALAGVSRWQWSALAFGAVLLVLLAVFWETAASMERTWRGSDSFQHTYLVPFILAYLVWEDRDRLAVLVPRVDWRGLALVLGASLGWLAGWAAQVQAVQQLALIGMVQGAVLALFGWPVVRVLLFPLAFMVFLVPMGDFLVPTLQRWTADFLVWSVRLLGIPIATDGFLITLEDGSQPYHLYHVAKECSGIRYLTAMFQIGLLTAYLLFRTWPRRVAAVAFAVIIPILANWLRALGIVLLGYYSEGERGMDVDHLIYGFWFFLFVLALYIGTCWLFAESPPKRLAHAFAHDGTSSRVRRTMVAAAAAVLLAAGVGPAYALIVEARETPPGGAMSAPDEAEGWRRAAYQGLDWKPLYRGADASLIARYISGGQAVDMYVARYDRQRQGAELINAGNDLAGAGWDDAGERHRATLEVDGETVTVRYVRLIRPGRQRLVFYWYRVNGNNVSSDIAAKLETTRARLLGGPQPSAVFAIATDFNGDLDAALTLTRDFVRAFSPTSILTTETH